MEHKTLQLSDCQIKSADNGQFEGYASTFGGVDSYGDTILKGAYENTLKEHGLPKMFVLHKSWELPVGKWLDAAEDDIGLYVKGELTPGMATANDVDACMKHETLDGLSIGYQLRKSDYTPSKEQEGGRIIKNVSILSEISPVVFPADNGARIDLASVKSALQEINSIRDFEYFLRDEGSFSKSVAALVITRAKSIFGQGDPAENVHLQELLAKASNISDRLGANN